MAYFTRPLQIVSRFKRDANDNVYGKTWIDLSCIIIMLKPNWYCALCNVSVSLGLIVDWLQGWFNKWLCFGLDEQVLNRPNTYSRSFVEGVINTIFALYYYVLWPITAMLWFDVAIGD